MLKESQVGLVLPWPCGDEVIVSETMDRDEGG